MASIATEPGGRRRIIVETADGKRKTIRLGKVTQRDAQDIRLHVERLAAASGYGTPPPDSTLGWLQGIGEKLHGRLAAAGLCAARNDAPGVTAAAQRVVTVASLFADYIARRTDLKRGSVLLLQQAQRHAAAFFRADREAASITVGDAKDYRRQLAGRYSEAYTSKMIRQARHVWRDAIDRKILPENPLAGVKVGSSRNPERQRFIDRLTIEKAIAVAIDPQWKLIIALSRYAGLRCPSEHLALTWADVDFESGRMLVRSSKTEHHAGKGQRWVPIFPELRPYLQAVFDQEAASGEVFVITRYRQANTNLRTQFNRILKAAGLTPWPRLFHNLRASCQTELVERFPGHVVCQWIGNSEAVARDHYLQVTDAHFAAAAGVGTSSEKVARNPAQQPAEMRCSAPLCAPPDMPKPLETAYLPDFAGVGSGPR